MPTNPAHSVGGPRRSVTKGVTPVLSPDEATALLSGMYVSTVVGEWDRYYDLVNRTFPKMNTNLLLPFPEPESSP